MIKWKLFIVSLFFFGFVVNASAINASLDIYKFESQENQYVDVYFRALASSISYSENKKGLFSANLDVLMYLKKDNDILAFEKYRLNTPEVDIRKDILDRKRFVVNDGRYSIELIMIDVQDTLNRYHVEKKFTIEKMTEGPHFGDIQLLSKVEKSDEKSFSKNGLYLEPIPFNLVNETRTSLGLYTEFYNSHPDTLNDFIFAYGIYPGIELSADAKPSLIRYKKVKQAQANILVFNTEVGSLISGDYVMRVMVLDKEKNVLYENSCPFIVQNIAADLAIIRNYNKSLSNSFVQNIDSARLAYSLQAIVPLVPQNLTSVFKEISNGTNEDAKRYFLLKFWQNNYPKKPDTAYYDYMKVADAVDKEFYNAVGRGFQTDRGYIYLKYGRPNKIISIEDEPNTPPYEIWYYFYLEATSQTDVKFLFYNPSLAPNDLHLLHSTCYGEKQNPSWELTLYRNSPSDISGGNTFESSTVLPNWQRRARKLFQDL